MKDILRPRGRMAHSPENRTGQAWRSGSVQVMGEDIFGNMKIFDLPVGHFRCSHCQEVVRLDERGFAACENCGMVYNDGVIAPERMSNRARKKILEKLKYDSRHMTG